MRLIDNIIGYPEFDTIIIIAIILGASFIAVSRLSENYPRGNKTSESASKKIYSCGEDIDPQELSREPQAFYTTFIKTFRLSELRKIHTGDLNEYLYWMFGAMIIIILMMVLQ